jgi:CRISPR/Cas system-associated exonuclease Cas4 (RecB family)
MQSTSRIQLTQHVLFCLRLAVHFRKTMKFSAHWRSSKLYRTCFEILKAKAKRAQANKMRVEAITLMQAGNLVTKVMMSLKYYVLKSKGAKLVVEKANHKLLTKAFDAIRYHMVSQRILTELVRMK